MGIRPYVKQRMTVESPPCTHWQPKAGPRHPFLEHGLINFSITPTGHWSRKNSIAIVKKNYLAWRAQKFQSKPITYVKKLPNKRNNGYPIGRIRAPQQDRYHAPLDRIAVKSQPIAKLFPHKDGQYFKQFNNKSHAKITRSMAIFANPIVPTDN